MTKSSPWAVQVLVAFFRPSAQPSKPFSSIMSHLLTACTWSMTPSSLQTPIMTAKTSSLLSKSVPTLAFPWPQGKPPPHPPSLLSLALNLTLPPRLLDCLRTNYGHTPRPSQTPLHASTSGGLSWSHWWANSVLPHQWCQHGHSYDAFSTLCIQSKSLFIMCASPGKLTMTSSHGYPSSATTTESHSSGLPRPPPPRRSTWPQTHQNWVWGLVLAPVGYRHPTLPLGSTFTSPFWNCTLSTSWLPFLDTKLPTPPSTSSATIPLLLKSSTNNPAKTKQPWKLSGRWSSYSFSTTLIYTASTSQIASTSYLTSSLAFRSPTAFSGSTTWAINPHPSPTTYCPATSPSAKTSLNWLPFSQCSQIL